MTDTQAVLYLVAALVGAAGRHYAPAAANAVRRPAKADPPEDDQQQQQ